MTSSPRRSAARAALATVLTAAVAGAVVQSPSPAQAADNGVLTREQFSGAQVSRAVVSNNAGPVTVRRGPRGSAEVLTEQAWDRQRPTVTTDLDDGVLTVRAACPRTTAVVVGGLNECSVAVTVIVPATAAVRATAAVGAVRTRGMRGDQRLSTDAGDVVVTAAAVRRLVARTSAGDVRLTVPAGRYDLLAQTDAGSAATTRVRHDPTARRTIRATTDAGDVTVRGR